MRVVRHGFTLLELLVAVAIIAVLIGLLLPAVIAVRAAAERMRCANHLKQIVLAGHHYHDAIDTFPDGYRNRPSSPRYLAWPAFLLPYLERQEVWDRSVLRFQSAPLAYDAVHDDVRSIVVAAFGCPADDRVRVPWLVTDPTYGTESRVALLSYLGSSGTSHRNRNGVLYAGSRTRMLDISDGTTHTLFAGERPPSPELTYGWWYTGTGHDGLGTLDGTMGANEFNRPRHRHINYRQCGPGPFAFQPGQLDRHCDVFHFWSLHSGGANFAFADGSVRFLSYSANPIMPALASRAGGEVVTVPD